MPLAYAPVNRGPASQALLDLFEEKLNSTFRPPHFDSRSRRPMINVNSMKRSRIHDGAFNLADLGEASKKVERSITFPEIEWPSWGAEEEDSEPEDIPPPSTKRPRLGMVRSSHSLNLVALNSSERMNSGSDDSCC